MGDPADARAALIEKSRAWRQLRQPSMDTAAGHRKTEAREHEARFQLANAALLWLWHEENPAQPATDAPVPRVECTNCHNANKYGDYEGPTCEVCMGDGFPGVAQSAIGCDEVALAAARQIEELPTAVAGQEARKTALIHLIVLDAIRCAEKSSWQPIATAPTHETVLVAGGDAVYPVTASWDGDTIDGWWVDGQEDVHEQIGWPTHWMPLPAGPSVTSTNCGGGK